MKKVLRKSSLVAGVLILVVVSVVAVVFAGDVIVKEGDLNVTGTGTFGSGNEPNGVVEIGTNSSSGWGELLLGGGAPSGYAYQLSIKGATPGTRQEVVRKTGNGYAFSLFDLKATNSRGTKAVGQVGTYGCVNQGDYPYAKYIYMGADESTDYNNVFVKIDAMNRLGLGLSGTNRPNYPLEVGTSVEDISIYALGGISGDPLIDRTSVFDKSKNVWDYIKDADHYLTDGEIDHKKFYGYVKYTIVDYSRPVMVSPGEGDDLPIYTYPYNKTEEGVSLGAEISVLMQAVFELKQENEMLKDEIARLKEAVGIE